MAGDTRRVNLAVNAASDLSPLVLLLRWEARMPASPLLLLLGSLVAPAMLQPEEGAEVTGTDATVVLLFFAMVMGGASVACPTWLLLPYLLGLGTQLPSQGLGH